MSRIPSDLYRVLNVASTASPDDIHAAWKRQMKAWHPDAHPTNKSQAEAWSRAINHAYSVLRDPAQRRAYDAQRRPAPVSSPPSAPPFGSGPSAPWWAALPWHPTAYALEWWWWRARDESAPKWIRGLDRAFQYTAWVFLYPLWPIASGLTVLVVGVLAWAVVLTALMHGSVTLGLGEWLAAVVVARLVRRIKRQIVGIPRDVPPPRPATLRQHTF